ncbi:MAG: glycoside hydrolase family 3 [Oscillospiraceae bacterium]|nr:glycoside hydrolase family 3 [Oscillospiraceae bacterium]
MAYQTDKVHYTEAGKWNPLRILALLGIMALVVALTGFGISRLKKPEPETVPDAQVSETESVTVPEELSDAEGVLTPEELEKESWFSRLVRTRSKAEKLLSEMSIRDKVYQLFIVFPDQLTGKPPVTEAGEDVRDGLDRYPVGGILFDRDNIQSRAQICNLLAQMQSYSRIPLLMTCDEEGGRVNRLMKTVGTPYVGPMLSYRDKGEATAKANAVTIAGGLTSCGFNMDFAPVADVWSNPANSVIGNRAYSTDFDEAAALVRAAVEGFHEGGVACTLKHFPGHGDTYEDSHNGLAKVYRTWNELEEAELKPFRAGIAAGADAVMVGHLIVGEIDTDPATISRVIVTDMLRDELGFEGVIITDSLQMDAITEHYSAGEVALRAMEAGVDVLLAPNNLGEAADALLSAVEEGRISESRIDESVMRVLQLKESYGILK